MKATKLTKVNIAVNHLPMHWPPVLAWQKYVCTSVGNSTSRNANTCTCTKYVQVLASVGNSTYRTKRIKNRVHTIVHKLTGRIYFNESIYGIQ